MSETLCPICRADVLVRAEGRLEQSGDTYLPTATWTCPCCEYRRFEPALRARWRAAAESGSESEPARRAA